MLGEQEVMGPQDLSKLIHVPVPTLYRWHHRGEGPPVAKVGRHLRYRREAVEQWLLEREAEAGGRGS